VISRHESFSTPPTSNGAQEPDQQGDDKGGEMQSLSSVRATYGSDTATSVAGDEDEDFVWMGNRSMQFGESPIEDDLPPKHVPRRSVVVIHEDCVTDSQNEVRDDVKHTSVDVASHTPTLRNAFLVFLAIVIFAYIIIPIYNFVLARAGFVTPEEMSAILSHSAHVIALCAFAAITVVRLPWWVALLVALLIIDCGTCAKRQVGNVL